MITTKEYSLSNSRFRLCSCFCHLCPHFSLNIGCSLKSLNNAEAVSFSSVHDTPCLKSCSYVLVLFYFIRHDRAASYLGKVVF